MNIKIVVFIFLSLNVVQLCAHISIQVDPDDFDQVSDFFEEIISHRRENIAQQTDCSFKRIY